MKKTQLLGTIFATNFIIATPLVSMASCGKNNIDIEKNPNIEIECKEIKVGEELVMKYKLDNDYGFNLEKSTITFSDSNGVVTLLECEIDRTNNTITVPAKYVTSTKVKIDIKAESSKSVIVTETQFNEAMSQLVQYTDTRAFKIGGMGVSKQYDPSGKEISSVNFDMNINADGYKDYYSIKPEDSEQPLVQYWGEKDSIVGAWQYALTYETEEVVKAPAPRSFASAFLSMMLIDTFPGYKKMSYDTLYNAYYAKWSPEQGKEYAAALKFNSNHKLTSIVYTESKQDEITRSINANSYLLGVEYSKPTISIPTQSTIRSEMMYETPSEYQYVNAQLECAIHQDCIFGRFDVPISQFTTFSTEKDLTLHLDHNANVGGCETRVAINGGEISPSLYTFDDTQYVLTIKKEAYSGWPEVEKLNIVIVNPGFGGASYGKEKPTKFIISQELDEKEVTLTPKSESFEALKIPLVDYNGQTITNKLGGKATASWTLKNAVTKEQRYKFSVSTPYGAINKTIILLQGATKFEVEFTTEEWAKITNGDSITIEPDYINKSCSIIIDSSFGNYFSILQINPNPVVEAGDSATPIYITVSSKPIFKVGTAKLVKYSDTTVILDQKEITGPASKSVFQFNVQASQWASIPYGEKLKIIYTLN